MVEMVARARVAEMREAAVWQPHDRSRPKAGRPIRSPAGWTASIRPGAARRAIGWFLISFGLRLALPRPSASGR